MQQRLAAQGLGLPLGGVDYGSGYARRSAIGQLRRGQKCIKSENELAKLNLIWVQQIAAEHTRNSSMSSDEIGA